MNNSTSRKAAMSRNIANWETVVSKQGKTSKEAQRLQLRLALNLFNQMDQHPAY
jgi:hypothetical protein